MISQIEKQSAQEIKHFQNQKLIIQLAYVQANSLFYQNHFKKAGIDIQSVKTIDDLTQLPVTTKTDLQENNEDFFCVDPVEIIDFSNTSGTTGAPVNFGLTEEDLNRLAFNEAQSFSCAGIQKHDIVQLMTTMDRQFMAGLAYFLGIRKIGAGIIRTGAGVPALQWNSILLNKPTYLIAVPSFLLKMIVYAEKNNIDINNCSVKAAICIGEPLRNQDFSPSELAKRINAKWDIKLYSTYASTEMSTAFTECEFHQGGHAHPELIITEVLDEENKPVKPGEVGELTITTLGVKALPLVRFKTGDIVKIDYTSCPCGRNTNRVGPVLGRAQQMVKFKGTTLYPPAIHDILNAFKEIESHLIILHTNDIGTDEVTVKIVSQLFSNELIQNLKEKFQAKLRVIPNIELIASDELNKLVLSNNSRKPKWVIDKRK
ncbi:phenylacetate--CoA ligase family protein [Brumimicrobium aurantiacum]|uniref:Phenylacetate--CoA ligase family protein n=1 Tax=Brumimicrobium aurantiacum TaxID=1737063 RepID=A0A3E1EZC5_9FLAO|nr:AMP-binding protein [Brumimicrobium aurantiacum]RFC54922.1 phenylacetate--CoA ligase family protein [Brumimicrobium aurantiacum]